MKIILFAILSIVVISCTEPADRYVKKFDQVDITKRLIPDTTFNLDYMEIKAKAQAENSCWRKLYFELKKTKDFEYTLKAYGTYESFGVCDAEIVSQDTAIIFQPTQKGTYLFSISRVPNKTEVDTMIVL
ncbi:MAG TPA: hypothetical protein DCL77_03765 [Prolixibacteraceae bacterium]|jgi:hypothetical protein|nr:hypothetical protein [Prolixibacteraceae bacterium]